MNLREEIAATKSKAQANKMIEWVGSSQKRFDELVYHFLNDGGSITQRAGWPLSYIAIAHPQLVKKHIPGLLQLLHKQNIHNAVKRNIVRLLQEVPIPENVHGEVMDICFAFIADVNEAIAVKAFSLTILENLAKIYPEINHELRVIIEERWEYETAAFHSRARKILKRMNRKKLGNSKHDPDL